MSATVPPKNRIFEKRTTRSAVIRINLADLDKKLLEDLQEKYGRADLEIHISPEAGRELLSEVEFWELISLLDWNNEGDDEAVIGPLVHRLSEMPVPFIYQFQNKLAEKLYHLDTQAHAEHSGENEYTPDGAFSVDIFLYQRCCVVANGRELYEEVLHHPEAMPFEALLHVAGDVYQRKTGKEMAYLPSYTYETFSNKEGWETAFTHPPCLSQRTQR